MGIIDLVRPGVRHLAPDASRRAIEIRRYPDGKVTQFIIEDEEAEEALSLPVASDPGSVKIDRASGVAPFIAVTFTIYAATVNEVSVV